MVPGPGGDLGGRAEDDELAHENESSVAQVFDSAARTRIPEPLGANQRTPGETILFAGEFNAAPCWPELPLSSSPGSFSSAADSRKTPRD